MKPRLGALNTFILNSHPPSLNIMASTTTVPQDIELIMQMVQGEMSESPITVGGPIELAPGEGVGETAWVV